MARNYYQDEPLSWPERRVTKLEEVPNTYDNRGIAAVAELTCGHRCVLTGDATELQTIRCKACAELIPPTPRRVM